MRPWKTGKKQYEFYRQAVNEIQGIGLFEEKADATKNYAYFPIIVQEEYKRTRDEIYDLLKENDIHARKYFYPLTADQACFRNKYKNKNLDNARKLSGRILILPMYEGLELQQIANIMDIIRGG